MRFCLICCSPPVVFFFFFFNDTATTEIYTLSLHDALPICARAFVELHPGSGEVGQPVDLHGQVMGDRKSTRLNSSHLVISYAVFCLKKKKNTSSPRIAPTRQARRGAGS